MCVCMGCPGGVVVVDEVEKKGMDGACGVHTCTMCMYVCLSTTYIPSVNSTDTDIT